MIAHKIRACIFLRSSCVYLAGLYYDCYVDVTIYVILMSVNHKVSCVCIFVHLFVRVLCIFLYFYCILVQVLGLDCREQRGAVVAIVWHSMGSVSTQYSLIVARPHSVLFGGFFGKFPILSILKDAFAFSKPLFLFPHSLFLWPFLIWN